MKNILIISLLLTALILSFGCSEDDKIVDSDTQFTIDEFPLESALGKFFIYDFRDTVRDSTDTIRTCFCDTTTIHDSEMAYTWEYYVNGDPYWTEYVVRKGDSIKIYDERSLVPYLVFVFPLEVGDQWQVPVGAGVLEADVEAIEKILVPAGQFNAYKVKLVLNSPALNSFTTYDFWLVPDVGIVRRVDSQFYFIIESREVMELTGIAGFRQ